MIVIQFIDHVIPKKFISSESADWSSLATTVRRKLASQVALSFSEELFI